MKDSLGNTIPKNALVIRHTEVSDFRNCRVSWYWFSHNGLNLTPIVKNPKLSTGSIWHKGLESHYLGHAFTAGVEEEYQHELERLEKDFGDILYDPEIKADLDEGKEVSLAVGEEYEKWANTEAYPYDKDLEVVFVEQRFVIPIQSPWGGNTRIWLAAKLDGIVRFANQLWVLEHKFLSKSSNVSNPDHLPIDLQMGLQLLVLAKMYPKERIGGAIYNLARKQKPGPRVKAPLFGRHIVERTPKELANLEVQLYMDALRMRECIKHQAARYPNPQPFGGKCTWGCAGRAICEAMMKGEDADYLLSVSFKERDRDIWQMLDDEMQD